MGIVNFVDQESDDQRQVAFSEFVVSPGSVPEAPTRPRRAWGWRRGTKTPPVLYGCGQRRGNRLQFCACSLVSKLGLLWR